MKCEKCGFQYSPGDQICINCGNKLPLTTITTVADIENMNSIISNGNVESQSKGKFNKKLLFIILGVVLVLIAGIVCYFIFR